MSLVVAAASTRTGCLVGDLVGDDLVGDGDLAGVGAGTGAYYAMCTAADAVAFPPAMTHRGSLDQNDLEPLYVHRKGQRSTACLTVIAELTSGR